MSAEAKALETAAEAAIYRKLDSWFARVFTSTNDLPVASDVIGKAIQKAFVRWLDENKGVVVAAVALGANGSGAKTEREKIVAFIKKRQDEIRHEDRDGAILLEGLAREIERGTP